MVFLDILNQNVRIKKRITTPGVGYAKTGKECWDIPKVTVLKGSVKIVNSLDMSEKNVLILQKLKLAHKVVNSHMLYVKIVASWNTIRMNVLIQKSELLKLSLQDVNSAKVVTIRITVSLNQDRHF